MYFPSEPLSPARNLEAVSRKGSNVCFPSLISTWQHKSVFSISFHCLENSWASTQLCLLTACWPLFWRSGSRGQVLWYHLQQVPGGNKSFQEDNSNINQKQKSMRMKVGVGYFLKGSLTGARPGLLVMTHQTRPWDSHLQSLENGKVWVLMLFASRRATRFSLGASWILCRLSLAGSLSAGRQGSGPTLPHDSAGNKVPALALVRTWWDFCAF